LYEFLLQFDYEAVAFMIKVLGLADAINLVDGRFFPEYNCAVDYAIYLVWSGKFFDLVLLNHRIYVPNVVVVSRPVVNVLPYVPHYQFERLINSPTRVTAYDIAHATENGVFMSDRTLQNLYFGLWLKHAEGTFEAEGPIGSNIQVALVCLSHGRIVQMQYLLAAITSMSVVKEVVKFTFVEDVAKMVGQFEGSVDGVTYATIMSTIELLRGGVNWRDYVESPLENLQGDHHVVRSDLNGANGSRTGTDDHQKNDLFSRLENSNELTTGNTIIVEYDDVPNLEYDGENDPDEESDSDASLPIGVDEMQERRDDVEDGSDYYESASVRGIFYDNPHYLSINLHPALIEHETEGDFYGANGETYQELCEVLIEYFVCDHTGKFEDEYEIDLFSYPTLFQEFLDEFQHLFYQLVAGDRTLISVRDYLDENYVLLNTRQLSFIYTLLNALEGQNVGNVEFTENDVRRMWYESEEVAKKLFVLFGDDCVFRPVTDLSKSGQYDDVD